MMTAKRNPRANLLRGISSDPAIAERQKAALIPGGNKRHGAYGGQALSDLRVQHDASLAEDFPHLDVRRRVLLADRLARCQLAMSWCDQHGITPTGQTRHGQAFPIVSQLDKWSAQADTLLAQAETAEREANVVDPGAALAAVYREYANADTDQADDTGASR